MNKNNTQLTSKLIHNKKEFAIVLGSIVVSLLVGLIVSLPIYKQIHFKLIGIAFLVAIFTLFGLAAGITLIGNSNEK
jgi:hypothetical protein